MLPPAQILYSNDMFGCEVGREIPIRGCMRDNHRRGELSRNRYESSPAKMRWLVRDERGDENPGLRRAEARNVIVAGRGRAERSARSVGALRDSVEIRHPGNFCER